MSKINQLINGITMPFRWVSAAKIFTGLNISNGRKVRMLDSISTSQAASEIAEMIRINGRHDMSAMANLILWMTENSSIPIVITSIMTEGFGGRPRFGSHGEGKSIDVMIVRDVLGNEQSIEYYSHLPTIRWVVQAAFNNSPLVSIGVEFDHLHVEVRGHERYEATIKHEALLSNSSNETHKSVKKFLYGDVTNLKAPHSPVFLFYSLQEFYKGKAGTDPHKFRMPYGINSLIRYI